MTPIRCGMDSPDNVTIPGREAGWYLETSNERSITVACIKGVRNWKELRIIKTDRRFAARCDGSINSNFVSLLNNSISRLTYKA